MGKKFQDVIDKDFKKWKKNKVIKRCPKCKMWTEKNHGCNHMTCAQCKHQWCWLCGGKYSDQHFEVGGGCAGLQFTEDKWIDCCLLLYLYKTFIFFGIFLLSIIGFLPATSFCFFFKNDFYDNCFVNIISTLVWFFWLIPYMILSMSIHIKKAMM